MASLSDLFYVGKRTPFVPPLPPTEKFMVKGRLMEIRNVWSENLEEELGNIRRLVDKYSYVAMVSSLQQLLTEYPPDLRPRAMVHFCL
jgi:hypothetical protein